VPRVPYNKAMSKESGNGRISDNREIEFQDQGSVERALFFYRSKNADFAECLHLGCAVTHDRLPLVTFDAQAARLDGAELLGSVRFEAG
jgi:predicted nucleic-acid-binding protein